MRPVDEKIVRMTLDNARFKDNVKDTLNSFKAIDDGINGMGKSDLSGIARAVDAIERRFSAFGVMAATVINRVTNAAIDMGKRVYSAFVDPIIEGGKKRSLNIEQAKFQFQGLGMDVEAAMKSANDAVLGTAFGLDEAAVVAAQFGATGMQAGEEMTAALRGISGVAAMTGSSYSDIGQIFTVVAGNGRLMSNELLRLSSRGINAAATLADQLGVTEQEVRELVTAGEISFEIFANAMSEAFGEHATRANETYSGSLSNLRAALGRIGAEIYTPRFQQLRDIFNATTPVINELKDAIMPLIDAYNEFSNKATRNLVKAISNISFDKFKELGGIGNLVLTFWNVMRFGNTILSSVREGFNRVFPRSFSETAASIAETIRKLTDNLNVSGGTAEKITTVFQGVFSIFSTVFEIAKQLAGAIFGIIPEGTGGTVLDFAVSLSEMAIAFNESVKEGNFLTEAIEGLGKILSRIGEMIKTPIKVIVDFARAIRENVGGALEWLGEKLAPVGKWFAEAFGDWGGEEILGGGFLVAITVLVTKLSGFLDKFQDNFSGFTDSFKDIFSGLGDSLKAFQEQVKYNNLLKIAIAIGIMAVSLKMLEGMKIADIAKGIGALTGSMAILALGMMAIEKLNFVGGIRASVTIIALAGAVLVMAGALRTLSSINIKELGTGLLGLAGIVAILAGAILAISKFGGKIKMGSIQLLALATSVVVLAQAVKTLSQIKASSLAKAVLGLAGVFGTLAIFLRVVDGAKIGPGTALGVLGIAAAIQIIVSAVERIADINAKELVKGLGVIAIILAEIAIFARVAGGGQILLAGAGITIIAVALNALMIPVTQMSKMSWEQLAKGLVGMAGALLAVSAAGIAATAGVGGAIAIGIMAVALTALMVPIKVFSQMSWGNMIKGFVGLGGGMALVAGAAMLLSPAIVPMLGFSAALLAMGAAALAVGAGISLFGLGLTTLATLTATSVAAIISALGLLLEGLGSLIISIVNFVVELGSALIGGLMKLVPQLVEAAIAIVMALVTGIANNIQEFVEAGYDIVIGLMKGIKEKAPELNMVAAETIVALIEGMADAIAENRSKFVDAVVRLMGEVILVVIEAGSDMITALLGWIPGVEGAMEDVIESAEVYVRDNFGTKKLGEEKGADFIKGLESTTPEVKTTAEKIATKGRDGVLLVDYSTPGSDLGTSLQKGLGVKSSDLLKTGIEVAESGKKGAASVDLTNTGSELGKELNTGLGRQDRSLRTTGTKIANSSKSGASTVSMTSTGTRLGTTLNRGVSSRSSQLRTSGRNLAISGRTGASGISMKNTGINFGNSFGSGIGSTSWFVQQKARALATAASRAVSSHLRIASPSKVLTAYGRFFGDGFGNGIGDRVKMVASKAKEMAVQATSALRDNLDSILPTNDEIRIKVDFDYEPFDPFGPLDDFVGVAPGFITDILPDPVFARRMADSVRSDYNQNENIYPRNEETEPQVVNHYNYEIGVTAGGSMSRAEVKKLAKDIQREIKNENDRYRISRGEEVVF